MVVPAAAGTMASVRASTCSESLGCRRRLEEAESDNVVPWPGSPPAGPHSSAPGQPVEAALALCAVCTVRQPCLEDALADDELIGIWGGTSTRSDPP